MRSAQDLETGKPSSVIVSPDSLGAATMVPNRFDFQSFCDTTALQKAVRAQATNEPIVASTLQKSQTPGYSVWLSNTSTTPIAIRFYANGQAGTSAVYVMKPGQFLRPTGKMFDRGAFSGFDYGLPFGWLGGGTVLIYVLRTPDADVKAVGNPEIPFHIMRAQILADNNALAAVKNNWPVRFPATATQRLTGGTTINQFGQPYLTVEPTRTIFRLRVNNLSSPAAVMMIFRGTVDMDFDGTVAGQVINAADQGYIDLPFPQETVDPSTSVARVNRSFPLLELSSGPAVRFGVEGGGVEFLDNGNAELTNTFLDIVRYGRL